MRLRKIYFENEPDDRDQASVRELKYVGGDFNTVMEIFMKKKLFFGTTLVCLLALTLVFAGCGCGGGGGGPTIKLPVPKSLKINNVSSELSGKNVLVLIVNDTKEAAIKDVTVAFDVRYNISTTLSLDLMVFDSSKDDPINDAVDLWTGDGDYYVEIIEVLSTGKLAEEGYVWTDNTGSAKKVKFDKSATTLDFEAFEKLITIYEIES